ncbi:hypothetical protein SDC9_162244 [bioreactor metagenome]|uniref:Uncharacterized protein n=1 Tax=bioreactor metagenome TaxID=1076179 RepID=A0A645FKJ6_9ZZZZ
MAVDTMLLNRYFEHLRCRSAIDVTAFGKHVLTPLLTSKPCDHAGFDGAKIRNDELCTGSRYKRCADKLRERVRHVLVEHF